MREIWLAGGCFWGVDRYVKFIRGVAATEVGYANGYREGPVTYEQVKHTETGHAETVHVTYDEAVLPLTALLRLFWRIIDPVSVDRQGEDVGHQYRTGVYWKDPADEAVVRASLAELQAGCGEPLAVEALPLENWWRAEEYHQEYLDKNPGGYCHVPLEAIEWVKTVDPAAFR